MSLEHVVEYLRCPHCSEDVHIDGATLACPAGHHYDVARQGYVNLLIGRAGPGTAAGRRRPGHRRGGCACKQERPRRARLELQHAFDHQGAGGLHDDHHAAGALELEFGEVVEAHADAARGRHLHLAQAGEGRREVVGRADHVIDQILHVPFRAGRRSRQLIGGHTVEHGASPAGCTSVQRDRIIGHHPPSRFSISSI